MSDPKFEKFGDVTTKAMEECAELIHILCKVQRFGWQNYHPKDEKKTPNYQLVRNEIDDVKKRLTELELAIREISLHPSSWVSK